MRKMLLGGLVALTVLGAAVPASHAAVRVNIGINLVAPPALVTVPGTPVAYAPSVAGNYFFYGGQYYVFAGNAWYASPRYNGPWLVLAPDFVPAPILTVPVRYYRTRPVAWRQWRYDAPPRWDPRWGRHWAPGEWERGGPPEHIRPPQYGGTPWDWHRDGHRDWPRG